MKISSEQARVLGMMAIGVQYTPKDLKAKWNTLTALYEKGLVADSITSRIVAIFTRDNSRRKFIITEIGVRHALRHSEQEEK